MSGKRSQEAVGEDGELRQEELSEFEKDDGSEYSSENEQGESDSAENGETSSKLVKRDFVDRLSSLPEPLLIHILTLLDMKKAVTTSVLSRRWKCLWTDLPELQFSESSKKREKTLKLVTRIHRVLSLRTVKYLDELEIRFAYDKCFVHDVDVWVEFALKHKVKYLYLGLHSCTKFFYMLPQAIYACSSLTCLYVQGCNVEPHGSINWRYLTELLIEDVELHEDVIKKILSGCPVLQDLNLIECWGFECLHIDSKSLDNLSIEECEEEAKGSLLEISAPFLRSLYVAHFPIGIKELRIKNIRSLARAHIHFSDFDSSLEVIYNVMELIRSIHLVKELEIGCTWVKVLSEMVAAGLQFPQSMRDSLILEARSDDSISGILALLESSPCLETLVLHCYDSYEEHFRSFFPGVKDDLDCDLKRLKTVHLLDYANPNWSGEPMLTMARVLLKRAPVLEKMVVDADGNLTEHSPEDSTKIAQTLLSYPKSSQNATITFIR